MGLNKCDCPTNFSGPRCGVYALLFLRLFWLADWLLNVPPTCECVLGERGGGGGGHFAQTAGHAASLK